MLHNSKIIAIPPGFTIKEQISLLGINEQELSIRLNLTHNEVIQLLEGDFPINQELANKLEKITNIPESFWLNLESNYRNKLLQINRI